MGLGFKNRHEGLASGLFLSPLFIFFNKKEKKAAQSCTESFSWPRERAGLRGERCASREPSRNTSKQGGWYRIGLPGQQSLGMDTGRLSQGRGTGLHMPSLPWPRTGVVMGPGGQHVPASPRVCWAALGSSQSLQAAAAEGALAAQPWHRSPASLHPGLASWGRAFTGSLGEDGRKMWPVSSLILPPLRVQSHRVNRMG